MGGDGGQRARHKFWLPVACTACKRPATDSHAERALQRAMHARDRKFAWRLGRARTSMGSSSGLIRSSRRARTLPFRHTGWAGAGCTTPRITASAGGPALTWTRAPHSATITGRPDRPPPGREWWGALGRACAEAWQRAEVSRTQSRRTGCRPVQKARRETKVRDQVFMPRHEGMHHG